MGLNIVKQKLYREKLSVLNNYVKVENNYQSKEFIPSETRVFSSLKPMVATPHLAKGPFFDFYFSLFLVYGLLYHGLSFHIGPPTTNNKCIFL